MQNLMKNKTSKNSGITLMALVITIIILLILAGISLNMLAGNNGVINHTISAKEKSEISDEKEHLEMAVVKSMGKHKYGSLTKTGLSTQLEEIKNSMPTSIESDEELNLLFVTFTNSGRVYQVNSDGDVTYLGNLAELKNSATITASPESSTTPQLVQYVDLKVETFVGLEDDEIFVHYAWTNSESKTPANTDYAATTCNVNSNKKRRSVTLTTEDTAEGNYYLWVQVVFNENTITKKYGPYAVKDHTTLVATNTENKADSGFLGNTEIPRNKIRSVTIKNSFGTHGPDETSWDVSASQNRTYLAWSKATTDATDGTIYDVVIEGKGGVVANTNASYLFANIGSGLSHQEVTINGLEYLDTGLTTNMGAMFRGCNKITNLNINKFNTSNTDYMPEMFYGCSGLTKLELNNFNIAKVTNLQGMLCGCSGLRNIDLSNFNTSNVISMSSMFKDCTGISNLDLSTFKTGNVTNMYGMFLGCSELVNIELGNFNTRKVTVMGDMFNGCSKLKSIDISKFDTNNVTNMGGMFNRCKELTSLDVTKFATSSVTNMSNMFNGCSGLTSLDVTKFNTSNVTNMQSMFKGCSGLTSLDVTKFNTSSVTNMIEMFRNCSSLGDLNVSHFDTKNVLYMNHTFFGCHALTSLNVSNFVTSNVITMNSIFAFCDGLTELDLKNFDTSNVENMAAMFYGCTRLTSIDISSFNTNKVTNMSQMFCGPALTSIDISNFDTRNVINMSQMFYVSTALKTIYVGDNWSISNVTSSDSMFTSCNNLVGDIPFNSSYIDKTYATKTGGYMTYKPST